MGTFVELFWTPFLKTLAATQSLLLFTLILLTSSPSHSKNPYIPFKYYEILGVHRESTEDEIKKSYRKLMSKYHPDKPENNNPQALERAKAITLAYDIVMEKKPIPLADLLDADFAEQFPEEEYEQDRERAQQSAKDSAYDAIIIQTKELLHLTSSDIPLEEINSLSEKLEYLRTLIIRRDFKNRPQRSQILTYDALFLGLSKFSQIYESYSERLANGSLSVSKEMQDSLEKWVDGRWKLPGALRSKKLNPEVILATMDRILSEELLQSLKLSLNNYGIDAVERFFFEQPHFSYAFMHFFNRSKFKAKYLKLLLLSVVSAKKIKGVQNLILDHLDFQREEINKIRPVFARANGSSKIPIFLNEEDLLQLKEFANLDIANIEAIDPLIERAEEMFEEAKRVNALSPLARVLRLIKLKTAPRVDFAPVYSCKTYFKISSR